MDVKVFNLKSKVNETRFVIENRSCGLKCELNETICNSKKRWDHNECRCQCKKYTIGVFVKVVVCAMFECNKACKRDECLDIKITLVKNI